MKYIVIFLLWIPVCIFLINMLIPYLRRQYLAKKATRNLRKVAKSKNPELRAGLEDLARRIEQLIKTDKL